MRRYDFGKQLAFSIAPNGRSFEQVIQVTLPGIVTVEKTDVETDKTGIDYIASLRREGKIYIDLKLRDIGCSKFWRNGEEEVALETWSVLPENGRAGKCGWTLDEAKQTHYTLHAFDPQDSERAFLLPFQLLRKAFRQHLKSWYEKYRHAIQDSGTWRSECVFVPISIVLDALKAASINTVKQGCSDVHHH